jgi:hypothetical protein
MASVPRQGVFCVEGAWDNNLKDRSSVLPTLELLERLQIATYIHRDVATPEELDFYLGKWVQRQYDDYAVLYIACHGGRGEIQLGRKAIALSALAERIGGRAAGRVIYFGSCSVMADRKAVSEFQESTKATLVCGYRKQVQWVDSAGFELILLDSLVRGTGRAGRVNRLYERLPDLTKVLGFESYPTVTRSS